MPETHRPNTARDRHRTQGYKTRLSESTHRRLGTVTEAAELLGCDAADVWQDVAAGYLINVRDSESEPWVIWQPRELGEG